MPLTYEEVVTVLKHGFYEEMSGVNLLSQVLAELTDPEIKGMVARIRDDEDKHVMMFAQILMGLMGR